jgi:acyl-CoA thioesterase-1
LQKADIRRNFGSGKKWGERRMSQSPGNRVGKAYLFFALTLALNCSPALAATVNIVAFGASDTLGTGKGRKSAGSGVSESDAFPAQIESMLRAKGIDAQVSNAGVAGDSTGLMLSRMDSAVPEGTQIVLLEAPTPNDEKFNISAAETARNVAQIKQALRARHIAVIYIGPTDNRVLPASLLNGDHPNKAWHTAVATKLLPQVLAAIRH